jgi:hypothetical protein
MGAFNTLVITVKCSLCSNTYPANLQFAAGEVWQHMYNIHDVILDAPGKNSIGRKKIMAYGIVEDTKCPSCGNNNPPDYDILIDHCVIKGYEPIADLSKYFDENDTDYYVIEDDVNK